MSIEFSPELITFFLFLPIFYISLSVHEFSHAYAAYKLGDDLAKSQGRMTLNPLKHIDLIGSVIMPFLAFSSGFLIIGWAKPVPVNMRAFKNPYRDDAIVSFAGPFSNLVFAFILALLINIEAFQTGDLFNKVRIADIITLAVFFNVFLFLFNLLPIPPLDGSHIIFDLFPNKYTYKFINVGFMGTIILLLFVFSPLWKYFMSLTMTVFKIIASAAQFIGRLLSGFSLAAVLILSGCGAEENKTDETKAIEQHTPYYVEIKRYKSLEEAELCVNRIKDSIDSKLEILEKEINRREYYCVIMKDFSDAYTAGLEAHKFFKMGLIDDYKILRGDKYLFDPFSNIVFLGKRNGRPSIYRYNLKLDETNLFWTNEFKKVLSINPAPDKNYAFFITAIRYGREGNLPFVFRGELYKFDFTEISAVRVDKYGDVIQFFTDWEDENSFRVSYNYNDLLESSFIISRKKIYDKKGNILADESKNYDLLKEGYPVPDFKPANAYSRDKKYYVSVIEDLKKYNALMLKYVPTEESREVFRTKNEIINVSFTDIENKIVAAAIEAETGKTKIYVYSIADKKITHELTASGSPHFAIRGEILVYENDEKGKIGLIIFDLDKSNIVKKISLQGGCGLRILKD